MNDDLNLDGAPLGPDELDEEGLENGADPLGGEQVSSQKTGSQKAVVAAVVGAVATVLLALGVDVDQELQAAVVTVVTAALVYLVPNSA